MVAHALTRIPKFHENHVTPTFGCPPEYSFENRNGMVFTAFNSKLGVVFPGTTSFYGPIDAGPAQ